VLRLAALAALAAACGAPPAATPAAPVLGPPDEVPAALPTELDDAVAPRAYRLDLAIDPADDGYRGEVAIDVAIAAPRRIVWLHGVDLTIERAFVTVGAERRPIATVAGAPGSGLIGLDLGRPITGAATLTIAFAADYRSLDGVFVQEYRARRYVFSDFEPTDARRGFPCFDAPRWKTPWTVSIEVPHGMIGLGNMPARRTTEVPGGTRVELEPTRPLPSYLIAVAVGTFDIVETRGAPVPVRLILPEGRSPAAGAARTLAPAMVAASAQLLGRDIPFPKLDIVAVPSFGGAMENPGLITMAADILLPPPGNVEAERFLALVLAHEAAHLWFGDLVTLGAWRELWLNEGFASWMADEVLATARPAWSTRLSELDDRAEAMDEDAVVGVRAVRPAAAPAPRDLFDVIGYKKSAAILHMLEGWLGMPVLAAAVGQYLDRHVDGTVTTGDVVAALGAADPARAAEIEAVLTTFLDVPGVPRFDGQVRCEPGRASVTVTGGRHTLGPAGDGRWSVPLCVRWSEGGRVNKRCQVVATGAAVTIGLGERCPAWTTLAAGADGYYLWSLPAPALAAVVTAADASARERIDAVRQVEPALLAGAMTVGDAVVVLDAAIRRGDERVTSDALAALRLLRDEIAPGAAQQLAPALAERLRSVGMRARRGEAEGSGRLRATLIAFAGRAGDPKVTAWARKETQRWLDRRSELDDELLVAAIAVSASAADRGQAMALVDAVIERSGAEVRRAAFALVAIRPQLADELLARSRRGGAGLQRVVIAGLLGRIATAAAAAAAVEADPGLAPVVAAIAPCDVALQARVTAAMGATARAPHLSRLVARAAARAAACQSARARAR
jgi:alanyl aminopeptidase